MTIPAASRDLPPVERTAVLADDPGASPDSLARRHRALQSLGDVRSPHLAPLVRVSPLDGGVALTHALPAAAVGLDRLRAAGPLRAGHVLGVVLDVVTALESLAADGLAHGGVTAERVLLDVDGSAVLAGTGLAWTRAPGDAGGPSPAEDVAAVGRLVRLLVGRVPDGSPVHAVADAAADPDPDLRPTLADLREALTACGRPERPMPSAIDLRGRPVPRPATRDRARPSRATRRPARPGRGGGAGSRRLVVALALLGVLGTARVATTSSAVPSPVAAPTPTTIASAVPASARPSAPPSMPVAVPASAPPSMPAAVPPSAPPSTPASLPPSASGDLPLDGSTESGDWVPVLAAVDAGRRAALGGGSADLLRRWVDPDGTSWAADAALVAHVAASGARMEGGELETLEMWPEEVAPERVVLLVQDRRTAYRVVDRDGRVEQEPARPAAWWRVTLTRGAATIGSGGWRLHDVEPADAASGPAAGGSARDGGATER